MCGIVCYDGKQNALDIIVNGLEKLEYRGYDSAGISVIHDRKIETIKKAGRLDVLENEIKNRNLKFIPTTGIGHTRWATHGVPTDENAHPHVSIDGVISVVHNGIIENYMDLKEELIHDGYEFKSDTDTEVVAGILAKYYENNLLDTVLKVRNMLEGSYAIGILSNHDPDTLIAIRHDAPLIAGITDDGIIVASDITSIIEYTKDVIFLESGDLVYSNKKEYKIYNKEGNVVEREVKTIDWNYEKATKEGYDHFMIKEINEQPQAIKEAISLRSKDGFINLENGFTKEEIEKFSTIYVVACGTAHHAGEVGKFAIEKFAKRPVYTEIASEFRYQNPFIDENSLLIVVSQSGETADTLAAIKEAKRRGAKVLSITNVVGSSIDRESDKTIYCYAGPEVSVASTKAYTTQLVALYFLALDFAYKTGKMTEEEVRDVIKNLKKVPEQITEILKDHSVVKEIANEIKDSESSFYIGRGIDYLSAKEGALKLKEVTYIHVEAFPAGELKHGSLALIEEKTPAFAIAGNKKLLPKTQSNIKEISARGGWVYGIGIDDDLELLKSTCRKVIILPENMDILMPILTAIPMQLLAYYTSVAKGIDVDRPRNLAKSVTVE